jgi:glutathione S-transferase
MSLDKYPNIQTYITRIEQRPSVQKALVAEGLKPVAIAA